MRQVLFAAQQGPTPGCRVLNAKEHLCDSESHGKTVKGLWVHVLIGRDAQIIAAFRAHDDSKSTHAASTFH
jgi:hypothetical protein